MSVAPLSAVETPTTPTSAHEPVAMLQLSVHGYGLALEDAASAVYQEYRLGRRVVVVVGGPAEGAERLLARLQVIGVPASGGHASVIGRFVTVLTGSESAAPANALRRDRPVRVALAGCGVVGGGIAERVMRDHRTELVGVLVRTPDRKRDIAIPPALLVTDPGALLAKEPDVLIELTSEPSLGLALIRAALARKTDVISASKQALIQDLAGLHALAGANDARLLYGAAVGGGTPMLELVSRAAAQGEIIRMEGVLNGTTNFILSQMATGLSFSDALKAAQSAGFAEADPSADLDGRDAAAKLALLIHHAGHEPQKVVKDCQVSSNVSGSTRQIARFDRATGVADVLLRSDSPSRFLELEGEANALTVWLSDGQSLTVKGRGAGRVPTTESVWADLLDLMRQERRACRTPSADRTN